MIVQYDDHLKRILGNIEATLLIFCSTILFEWYSNACEQNSYCSLWFRSSDLEKQSLLEIPVGNQFFFHSFQCFTVVTMSKNKSNFDKKKWYGLIMCAQRHTVCWPPFNKEVTRYSFHWSISMWTLLFARYSPEWHYCCRVVFDWAAFCCVFAQISRPTFDTEATLNQIWVPRL